MQQQTNIDYSEIDVKIQLAIGGKKSASNVKRIKAPASLQELKDALTSFAAKQDIAQPIVQIMYKDKGWVDVSDEDDYKYGMNAIQQFSKNKSVTFVASYEKSANLEEKKQSGKDKQLNDIFDMETDAGEETKGFKKERKVREKKLTRKQLREMGVDFETPGEGEDARKRSRSERKNSKNARGEGTPFGEKAKRNKSTPKRERADGFERRMSRDFMKMVNGFLVKIGGKEEQEKMKHEFYQIMKEGTEEQK